MRVTIRCFAIFACAVIAIAGCAGNADPDLGPTDAPEASILFGYTLYGSDYAILNAAPSLGVLFSAWTRIVDPSVEPDGSWVALPYVKDGQRGYWNTENFNLYGENWKLRFITGNSRWDGSSRAGWYNANGMFAGLSGAGNYVYGGDYCSYGADPLVGEESLRGWVWVAWQTTLDFTAETITMRQWLKFGRDGPVIEAGADTVGFAAMRYNIAAGRVVPTEERVGVALGEWVGWAPGRFTGIQVGQDNGYMTRVRVEDRATVPSLAELERYASQAVPDASAWAWYPLAWRDGAAYLRDDSGRGRHLAVAPGGMLRMGAVGP